MDRTDGPDAGAAHARSVKMLAGAAIVISLTGPFWLPLLFGSLNIHTAGEHLAAENRAEIGRLDRLISGLDQSVLSNTASVTRLQADTAQTTQRIGHLADAMSAVATTELGAALRQPGGFIRQFAAVRVLAPSSPEIKALIDRIAPYAETGVPDRRQLRMEFVRLAAIDHSANDVQAIAWLKRMLAGDQVGGDETTRLMAEATQRLRDDDLAAALASASLIPEPRPPWLAAWIDDATARVAADELIRRVDDRAAWPARVARP